jgi:hypothetical protein
MRLQLPGEQQVILVMPQEKIPVPDLPEWLQLYGSTQKTEERTMNGAI